jgi:DNA mismatch repair protein MutS
MTTTVSTYDTYFDYVVEYRKKYGPKTVVLIEIGGFFEFYAIINDEEQIFEDIHDVCSGLLNMIVTKKNKSIIETNRKNPLFSGFPSYMLKKYLDILVSDAYTVVLVEQTGDLPGNRKKRDVTEIISPSTYIDGTLCSDNSNYTMCCYIVENQPVQVKRKIVSTYNTKPFITLHICLAELTLGISKAIEVLNQERDDKLALDDLYRILLFYQPTELLLKGVKCRGIEDFLRTISTSTKIVVHNRCEDEISESFTKNVHSIHSSNKKKHNDYAKLSYQQDVLRKIYPKTGHLSPIEYIGMEKMPNLIISFIFMLSFINEHNEKIAYNLRRPDFDFNTSSLYSLDADSDNSNDRTEGIQQTRPKYLTLVNNCIRHLNITSESPNDLTLMKLLNVCKTTIGKRYFKLNILHPLTNSEIIEKRYNLVDQLITEDKFIDIRTQLKNIQDIERLYRRLGFKKLEPIEFYLMYQSFTSLLKIITKYLSIEFDIDRYVYNGSIYNANTNDEMDNEMDDEMDNEMDNEMNNEMNNEDESFQENFLRRLTYMLNKITKKVNIDEMSKYNLGNIHVNIFKKGVHPTIDKVQDDMDYISQYFKDLHHDLNKIMGVNTLEQNESSHFFKLEVNDKIEKVNRTIVRNEKELNKILSMEYYQILVTKQRFDNFKKTLSNSDKMMLKNKYGIEDDGSILTCPAKNSDKSTGLKLNNSVIVDKSLKLNQSKEIIHKMIYDKYLAFLENLIDKHDDVFREGVDYIQQMDFYSTIAYNSVLHHYIRPTILSDNETKNKNKNKKSMIHAKGVRHPLIEHIQTDTEYIANDICLGKDDSISGMLLYGINATGKTSCMKSVGLNIIMAQCGMFVPCIEMEYYPYEYLFSRIPSGDNIYKGQSTFVSEMMEIRNILKMATPNSLVIGDELCCGTESTSATSLVTSGILSLCEIGSSFMFATHLHDICDLDEIQELLAQKKLQVCHMSVHYDKDGDRMIFDRKIKEGDGDRLYGLEVCKSLDLDTKFLHNANKIRQRIMGINNDAMQGSDLVSHKRSRYNSQVYVSDCSICGSKADEVHHLKQQKDADSKGFIVDIEKRSVVHKNKKHNLIAICEKCHDKIHNGELEVNGFIKTSNGVELL